MLLSEIQAQSFKKDQLRYSRVRTAYAEKESSVLLLLSDAGLEKSSFNIYLRAFKQEKEIELWAKDVNSTKFSLLKTYKVCATCGELGPKRQQGDLQIPEGYYHIDRFNPASNFYLSLGINYPNASDKILGTKGKLGGDIFIHGACVTIGCLPITDDQIKELYVFCIEARNHGQTTIPVSIFPTKLTDKNYQALINENSSSVDCLNLWKDLKKGFDIFDKTKLPPNVSFLRNGRHHIGD